MNPYVRALYVARVRSKAIAFLQETWGVTKNILAVLGVLCLVSYGWYGWYAGSQSNTYEELPAIFPDCDREARVCVVEENPGGSLSKFLLAADALARNGYTFKVYGVCASACATALDYIRERSNAVCITEGADFEFHKAKGFIDTFDPPQSAEVLSWVALHGGFPDTSKPGVEMLKMPYSVAATIWRPCS